MEQILQLTMYILPFNPITSLALEILLPKDIGNSYSTPTLPFFLLCNHSNKSLITTNYIYNILAKSPKMSQPHFEGSVRSPFTLPKMGLGSPLGLPKTQNAIAGVKTPCIEVFFIPLEIS
jgi:hypothetical protein